MNFNIPTIPPKSLYRERIIDGRIFYYVEFPDINFDELVANLEAHDTSEIHQ